jgi:hypothetical protein
MSPKQVIKDPTDGFIVDEVRSLGIGKTRAAWSRLRGRRSLLGSIGKRWKSQQAGKSHGVFS